MRGRVTMLRWDRIIKHMRYVAIALFLCVVLVSNGQSDTLDSLKALRFEVMRQLLVKDTGNAILTATRVDGFINRACRRVANDFPATPALDTVTMLDTLEVGALNADFLRIKSVGRIQDSTLRMPLIWVSRDSLRWLLVDIAQNTNKKRDIQTPKYYSTNGSNLLVAPKSTLPSVTFLVEYYAEPLDLTADADTTNIRFAYREEIIVYACKLAARAQSAYAKAEVYKQDYLELIQLSKDDK